MNKVKIRLLIFLITFIAATQVALGVLFAEKNKKLQKAIDEKNYYSLIYSDFEVYRRQYLDQVTSIKGTNSQQMADAKKAYDELLAKQPDLIKNNGQQIIVRQPTTVATPTTVKVSKPASTPKTKTS